jgi:hypothetical protein
MNVSNSNAMSQYVELAIFTAGQSSHIVKGPDAHQPPHAIPGHGGRPPFDFGDFRPDHGIFGHCGCLLLAKPRSRRHPRFIDVVT